MTEGRQERGSPRAFVRSSHDQRIDLFEVGEASTVRPAHLVLGTKLTGEEKRDLVAFLRTL